MSNGFNTLLNADRLLGRLNCQSAALTPTQQTNTEEISNAAENEKEVMLAGLSTLGEIVACADQEELQSMGVDLRQIGWLIHNLTDLVYQLDHLQQNADYRLNRAATKGGYPPS
ncbi:MAG: hypothetical protein HN842_08220 [Gammaproteobacteria bacterium]|jgi:hypothetical protein|nr:hypothetical protein [Gammaproteobacteria bacterium]